MAQVEHSTYQLPETAGRVLLVDDEPELRRTLRRALARYGFEVLEAENGRVALELMRQQPFDVIVSDVRMPEMDGLQLLQRALRDFPLVPVVLMSAATGSVDAEDLVEFGALEFLEKDRTTIIIAHRLATVLQADRIVVMNEGRIEDIGRHDELVRRNALYARLAELQFGENRPADAA